jgi:DNA-binding NtrC family response regulator
MMKVEGNVNATNSIQRRALMVDDDRDRYRRKERTDALKQAGYKVYPVLRLQDVCTRCKPGAFDVIVVNGTQNPALALEVSDQIKSNDPNQRIILFSSQDLGSRDFIVSDWQEVLRRLGGEQTGRNLAA